MKTKILKYLSLKDIMNGTIASILGAFALILISKIETPKMVFDFSSIVSFLIHNLVTLILAFISTIAFMKAVKKDMTIIEFRNEITDINREFNYIKDVSDYRASKIYIGLEGHRIVENIYNSRIAKIDEEVKREQEYFTKYWSKNLSLREDDPKIIHLVQKYCVRYA